MFLYLMRHGHAEDFAPSDGERSLTEKGRARSQEAAEAFLIEKKWDLPNKLVSSELRRAAQTAEIVKDILGIRDLKFVDVQVLLNWESMRTYLSDEPILFVGHQPALGAIIEGLTGQAVRVKKASIHKLDYDPILDKASYIDFIE
ncbi:MAG: phosphoglycerate mutase family protein [Tissierellia bacterium]|nr:phosphoglycerate mutase family protein [Tissierellia bacterium]